MKNLLIKAIPFACFIFILTACQPPQTGLTPEQIAENWNNTKGKLVKQEANQLEENYKKFLYDGSRDSLTTPNGQTYMDSREVWFDLEDLKNYINYVEQYGKDNNFDHLGMRVYLGSYGPQQDGMPRTTVFFYGTGRSTLAKQLQGDDDVIVEPNLPGADGFNKGNSGMPPNELQYP